MPHPQKQMIQDQSPGGKTHQIEVDSPPLNTQNPQGTSKDYAPDPSRRERPSQSYGIGEGDQTSDAGSFGRAMFNHEDANNLVRMVRHDRIARNVVKTQTPSFGDVAQQTRDEQAMQQEQAAQQPQAPDPQQIAGIAQSLKFVADTRTGHIEPVFPNQPDPALGPHDIIFSQGQDPSQPNILAQGKRVTPQAIARLSDPKRAIQPSLKPGYQLPDEYAHLGPVFGGKA